MCAICDEDFDPSSGGGTVTFAERDSDREWYKRMDEPGYVGHPPNVEWFCKKHHAAALECADLPRHEAMATIRAMERT